MNYELIAMLSFLCGLGLGIAFGFMAEGVKRR